MSIQRVKDYLQKWGRDKDVMEFATSSATVAEAAETIGTEPSHIAKSLSFMGSDGKGLLVVTAGDRKIDNKKYKQMFGMKARMLSPEEVEEQTGHKIGGVCPFGLTNPLPVYLDVSLKRFDDVYPACGSGNSAIQLTTDELFEYANALEWVDVCKAT
ncbi:MAG TPA: YbaK/EbsC family protein [Virgibacillus sp.]|nr:YbaK/EbsC family protein [Virgibacillus sp.]